MTTPEILPLAKIEILYSEAGDRYKGATFTSWTAAECALIGIACQVKGEGGYKTAFRITWNDARWGADGDFTYEGQIIVKEGAPSLRSHVRSHCLYTSGRATPPWRTEQQWAAYLDACVPEEKRRMLGAILDGCQLDDARATA